MWVATGEMKHLQVKAGLIAFGLANDPQPMHTDPEAAKSGPFGGLVASGWSEKPVTSAVAAALPPVTDSQRASTSNPISLPVCRSSACTPPSPTWW